jgi:flagellar biosynthesis protein FliR
VSLVPDFLNQAFAPDRWPVFVLITARVGGLMLSAPLWSMTMLPHTARAAITVLISILLLPLAPHVTLPEQVLDLPLPMAIELIIGISIGLTAAVLVQGVGLAGEVLSLQMGLSLGPALAPTPDVPVSGVGQIKSFLALILYLAAGGHLVMLRGLADSLTILPPGAPLNLAGGAGQAALFCEALFGSAVRAAAPVMVALLLSNLALAILSRAVPQINAMMVSLPLTVGVGLVTIGLTLPVVSGAIARWMGMLPASVDRMLAGFR